MREVEGPWAGRDEALAEYRRLEIATALLAGLAVFAVPTLGLHALIELTGLAGPRWNRVFAVIWWGAAVSGPLVLVGWLVRSRRRERCR